MIKNKLAQCSALPAIAAALALSSTPLWAQEAQPASADPAPVTQPAPEVTDPASAPAEASVPTDTNTTSTVTETATKTVKSPKRISASKAAPVLAKTVRIVKPAPAVSSMTATSTTIASTRAMAPTRPTPVVDLSAQPAPVAATAAKPAKKSNDALPIAGGALAFLAIGGAAVAMTRRRNEEEWTDETVEQEPSETQAAVEPCVPAVVEEQPAIIAPSAFAWDRKPQAVEPAVRTSDETHVERAYRGPTPENPSLSLRKRLKRAAFMDKREREVAAGLSTPVEPTAGLPEGLVEQDAREHEFA